MPTIPNSVRVNEKVLAKMRDSATKAAVAIVNRLGVYPSSVMMREEGVKGYDEAMTIIVREAFAAGLCNLPLNRIPYKIREQSPWKERFAGAGCIAFVKPDTASTMELRESRRKAKAELKAAEKAAPIEYMRSRYPTHADISLWAIWVSRHGWKKMRKADHHDFAFCSR